jgi:equilibrative nucleoside transporter 1/2/3
MPKTECLHLCYRYPVILIALFNFADLAGKEMPAWRLLPEPSERAMLLGSVLRVVFVPAFYFAAGWGAGPLVIGALTVALGVSNGYLTAVTMMACPRGYQVAPTCLPSGTTLLLSPSHARRC